MERMSESDKKKESEGGAFEAGILTVVVGCMR